MLPKVANRGQHNVARGRHIFPVPEGGVGGIITLSHGRADMIILSKLLWKDQI